MPADINPENKTNRKYLILSIDGGGIRGIIPATVLLTLEWMIKNKTGNPHAKIGDYFDFIAGTSTGGILTCILLFPDKNNPGKAYYSTEDAKNFYKIYGEVIFNCSIWQKVTRAGGLIDEKYDQKAWENLLLSYFKNTTLDDLIKPCLITGYDIKQYRPVFFNKVDAAKPKRNYYLRDVARATTAAPTFFEPALTGNLEPDSNANPIVDGGTFANNPAACALVEVMRKGYGLNKGVPLQDIVILSLGTGQHPVSISYEECRDWGKISWTRPLIGILMEGIAQTVDYQLKNIFESLNIEDQYLRIDGAFGDYVNNLDIPGLNPALDCATQDNIEKLIVFGENLALGFQERLDAFVNRYF